MILKPNTGIDISHWQKGIKIANLKPLPRFAVIKATDGTNYIDDTLFDFSAQIRALGIPLGFYHFWRNVDATKQASLYLQQINLAGGMERIPPVLDLEVDLTGQVNNVKRWLDMVEGSTGKRPILYGTKAIFSKLGNPVWFKNYDIWTASYPYFPDIWSWCPPIYQVTTGRREIMWQYASTYKYPAYPLTKIDTDIAIPEFLQEIGAVTPPPPTGETMIIGTVKSTTNILSVRNVYQVIGSTTLIKIPIGTTVNVQEVWKAPVTTAYNNINDFWALVTYGAVTGWVGLVHLGVSYGVYTPSVVIPPPPTTFAHSLDVTLDGVVVFHKDFN
jgi:hypothetical protein